MPYITFMSYSKSEDDRMAPLVAPLRAVAEDQNVSFSLNAREEEEEEADGLVVHDDVTIPGVPLRDKGRRRRCDEGRSRGAPGFGLAGRSDSRDAAGDVASDCCEWRLDLSGSPVDLGARDDCSRNAVRGAMDSRSDVGKAIRGSRDKRGRSQRRRGRPPPYRGEGRAVARA